MPGGHRAAADQPDRHAGDAHRARTASRSRRSTTPGRGTRSTTTRSACSPGWPRSTPASSGTPTTTSGACSTTWRQTEQLENTLVVVVSDNGASGEGGPNGSVNEMKFANGVPDDLAAEPREDRRARRHEDLQPLPERLGDGVQHAVQDVEALRVQRRHLRPVHHLVAGGDEGARRDPRPVPPRDRHRADHPRHPRRRAARDDQGAHVQSPFDGVSMREQLRRRVAPTRSGRRSSTRCSARARSGTRAGRP